VEPKPAQRRRSVSTLVHLALFLALAHADISFAFAEDVCPAEDGGWQNCSSRPCETYESGAACESVAMFTTARSQTGERGLGARSTVHFDATYYLAQAAGFGPRAALTIAGYDQAVDTGRLWLRGEGGELLARPGACESAKAPRLCELSTRSIIGTNRNDFAGGGVFFHFMPPPAGHGLINGLAPPLDDPQQEPFLAHLRRWAEGRGPLCVGGLTQASANGDYATGEACYQSRTRPDNLLVGRMPSISELGVVGSVDWAAPMGQQALAPDTRDGDPQPASKLASQFGDSAALVRLGIYAHAVQDRISHHICLDASELIGPRAADAGELRLNPLPYTLYQLSMNTDSMAEAREQLDTTKVRVDPEFVFEFDREQCDQPHHALRHTLETGEVQAELAAADRTTEAALRVTLRLLEHFAANAGVDDAARLDEDARAQLVSGLVSALEAPQAGARIAALGRLATAQGWAPLPAHAGMAAPAWVEAYSTAGSAAGAASP